MVPLPGVEPGFFVPKTNTLSIKLQGRKGNGLPFRGFLGRLRRPLRKPRDTNVYTYRFSVKNAPGASLMHSNAPLLLIQ